MNAIHESTPRHNITAFLFWFRIVTVVLVAVISLTGIKPVPVVPLALAIGYNALIFSYRSTMVRMLSAYPVLIAIDIAFSFVLLAGSGGYKSPYYLYGFSPLVLGSFLFRYPGALSLSALHSIAFFVAVELGGYRLSDIVGTGEHIITDFFFFFIASFSVAYLSDLLHKLDAAQGRKAEAESKLADAKAHLALSLKFSQLSRRESDVFLRMAEGKTIEQIAAELDISKNTAKTYLSRAYRKLGVSTQQEAIVKIVQLEE